MKNQLLINLYLLLFIVAEQVGQGPAPSKTPTPLQWPQVAYARGQSSGSTATSGARNRSTPPAPVQPAPAQPNGPLTVTASPRSNPWVNDPTLAPYTEVRTKLDGGRVSEAIAIVEDLISKYPRSIIADPTASLLADAYLMQGRPAEAFAVLQPYLGGEESSDLGNDTVVRASVAAALLGRNYPGQEEFVTRFFRYYDSEAPLAVVTDNQKRLIYLSCIAATVFREYNAKRLLYAELALRIVPGDPLATSRATDIYIARGQPEPAKALLDRVANSPNSEMNDIIQQRRWAVAVLFERKAERERSGG